MRGREPGRRGFGRSPFLDSRRMSNSTTTTPRRPRWWAGLVLMLLAAASFAGMAAFVKALRVSGLTTVETVVWRLAPGLPGLWLVLRMRGVPIWKPRRPLLSALRSGFGGLAMAGSFYAVGALTLVQHTMLHLTQPGFVALFAPGLVGERLRGVAIVALLLALGGALATLHIDQAALQSMAVIPWKAALAGLAGAMMSALAHLTIRMATGRLEPHTLGRMGRGLVGEAAREAPETVVFHFTLHLTVAGLVLGLLNGDFQGLPPELSLSRAVVLILGMAGLGALGQLSMSTAYSLSQAPVIAIVAYAGIPVSMVLDVLLWGEVITVQSLLGGGLMILAGLLLARSRR